MTEDVIIDFKIGVDELTPAFEQLAKAGKIDPKGFQAVSQSITKTATDTNGLIAKFKSVATTATQLGKTVENAFSAGVQDALDEAGVSAEEFALALSKANTPAKTLKAELRELKEALALAKVNGKDTGDEFERMRARAGALADAIQDAGAEIKNAGSDTRNIDNVVGSISALAGGFAAVQGAAALFGDENEDLQKALLKVNGAMALASGVQQFYNATLKEGSLTKLADSVATGIQTATQRVYTLVTGQATAATVAFKVALAATGIGLFVVGVLALVSALQDTEESLEDVNRQLANQQDLLESSSKLIDRQTERQILLAKEAGKSESDLIRIRGEGMVRQFNNLSEINKTLVAQAATLDKNSEGYANLRTQIDKNIDSQNDLADAIKNNNIEGRIAVTQEAKERQKLLEENAKKAREAAEKQLAAQRAAILARLNDELAALEKRLLFAEKNSQDELSLQKLVINKKRDIELQAEKLTANQVKLIRARAYAEREALDKAFNERATAAQLQSIIDTNAAILAGVSRSNEERLQLQIENINAAAQLEINAAEGNATKILLIEAKKIADIRALKNAAIDADLAEQQESTERTNSIVRGGLFKIIGDVKQLADVRKAASEGVLRQERVEIQAQVDANNAKEQSNEDYQKKNNELREADAKAALDHSARLVEIDASEKEQRKQNAIAIVSLSIELLGRAADFASQLNQLAAEQDQARIEAQKRQLQELEEAGAITQKNAEVRAKQIEILERQARQRQAQREKSLAVFNALLAIPSAFLEGLKQGGPVLGAVYAALAAAQAALVISRPVPKFFRGKKPGTHEGEGIVGDMGAELVERNGRMFLYTKPTQTYLAKGDTVYTAAQTRQIMHNTKADTALPAPKMQPVEKIDYSKMPKASVSINIEKDFISEAVGEGLMKNKYFNNRYKF